MSTPHPDTRIRQAVTAVTLEDAIPLLSDPLPSVRRMLAMNDAVPVEVLYRLTEDPELSVRQGLFVNPKVTVDILAKLIPTADVVVTENHSYYVGLRMKLIRCLYEKHYEQHSLEGEPYGAPSLKVLLSLDDVDPEIIDFIIKHRVFLLAHAALASREDIPSWLLDECLHSDDVTVVVKAARNPSLSEGQIREFFQRINSFGEKSWMVKSHFIRNPLLPEDLMMEYALTESTHAQILLGNPNVTSRVLDVVAENQSRDVLHMLATNPRVSDELLFRLWSDEELKRAVEGHYSTQWKDEEEDYNSRLPRLRKFAEFLRVKAAGAADGMPDAWVFKMFGFNVADWG